MPIDNRLVELDNLEPHGQSVLVVQRRNMPGISWLFALNLLQLNKSKMDSQVPAVLGPHLQCGLKLSSLIQPVRSFLLSQQSGNHIGHSSNQVLLYTANVSAVMTTPGGGGP